MKSKVKKIEPIIKICKRCGDKFDNPTPPITNPGGVMEIATIEWCSKCNAAAMTVLYRGGGSAFTDIKSLDRKVAFKPNQVD